MEKAKEPTKAGNISGGKTTADIVFGEKTYTILKLKAGKFYEALEVYMNMIKEVAPKTPASGKGEAEVDFDKLVVSMFTSWPEQMVKFITVCCSSIDIKEPLTEKKIKEEAYPEQVTKAFSVCLKLNNVAANLKNFVAPIGELGAEVGERPKK